VRLSLHDRRRQTGLRANTWKGGLRATRGSGLPPRRHQAQVGSTVGFCAASGARDVVGSPRRNPSHLRPDALRNRRSAMPTSTPIRALFIGSRLRSAAQLGPARTRLPIASLMEPGSDVPTVSPPSWSHPIARVMEPPRGWARGGSPASLSHPIARVMEPLRDVGRVAEHDDREPRHGPFRRRPRAPDGTRGRGQP
jgi:hypothetical protein